MICGNGGSAAQASHFSAEIVVRYKKNRRALPCLNLCADQSIITACANDIGYPHVFSRQVDAFGKPGDVLIALSTSFKSPNVTLAMEAAFAVGMEVIKSPTFSHLDIASHQQEHLYWLHKLAQGIEEAFCV